MRTHNASILLVAISLALFMVITLTLIPGQASRAGQHISPVNTPTSMLSPVPTPFGGSTTFVSPLLPEDLTPQAYLPIVAHNYPLYLTYGKKGIGDSSFNWIPPKLGTNMAVLNYDWYYDWRYNLVPERNSDPRYVRMVVCVETNWPDRFGTLHTITDTARDDFINNRRGRLWLVYNEPDEMSQCGREFLENGNRVIDDAAGAAHHYSTIYDMIKSSDPYAKVFGGGLLWLNTTDTRSWWQTFVNTLQSEGVLYKLEGVHVHLYPEYSTAPTRAPTNINCIYPNCVGDAAQVANNWYSQMHVGMGLSDRSIWITEMGWLSCTDQTSREWVRDNVMIPMAQWFARDTSWPYTPQVHLNSEPGYNAVAWFATQHPTYSCTFLLNSLGLTGTLTSLGVQWNTYHP